MRETLFVMLLPGFVMLLRGAAIAGPGFAPVELPAHVYDGGWEHFVGGGVAGFDCNGDRFPELFAAGGSNPAELFINETGAAGAPLAMRVETPEALALTHVTGAYPLDIDGDGVIDLAVMRVGENLLLKGGPDCSFAPFDLGFTSPDAWTTSFTATWEAGRRLPTLFFGNYVDRDDPDGPFEACDTNRLYRADSGTYSVPISLEPGYCALSALFTDWDRQGRADLRLSNDRQYYVRGGQEELWAMESTPRLYTEAEGWRRQSLWGMGIASRDVNGDGLADVFLSTMGDQKLQLRDPVGPVWRDVPFAKGTAAQRPHLGDDGRPSTGWSIVFGDVDLDGYDDVFIAKGNVEQMPSNAMEDPNNLLMQQSDGSFREASIEAGVASIARSRGAVLADLNLDGLLDLAVVNRRAPMELYQNVTATEGHWLAVELAQPGPNRRAVGAWLDLRVGERIFAREITVGGTHASGVALPEHFGLGASETAELRVTWPDGTVTDWLPVTADCTLRVTRGTGSVTQERL